MKISSKCQSVLTNFYNLRVRLEANNQTEATCELNRIIDEYTHKGKKSAFKYYAIRDALLNEDIIKVLGTIDGHNALWKIAYEKIKSMTKPQINMLWIITLQTLEHIIPFIHPSLLPHELSKDESLFKRTIVECDDCMMHFVQSDGNREAQEDRAWGSHFELPTEATTEDLSTLFLEETKAFTESQSVIESGSTFSSSMLSVTKDEQGHVVRTLSLAHAGDSVILMRYFDGSRHRFLTLSNNHHAKNEPKRLDSVGAIVSDSGRLLWSKPSDSPMIRGLEPSRTLGDSLWQQSFGVTAECETSVFPIPDDWRDVTIWHVSDGVTNAAPKSIFVNPYLVLNHDTLEQQAEAIVRYANYVLGAVADNTTVLVRRVPDCDKIDVKPKAVKVTLMMLSDGHSGLKQVEFIQHHYLERLQKSILRKASDAIHIDYLKQFILQPIARIETDYRDYLADMDNSDVLAKIEEIKHVIDEWVQVCYAKALTYEEMMREPFYHNLQSFERFAAATQHIDNVLKRTEISIIDILEIDESQREHDEKDTRLCHLMVSEVLRTLADDMICMREMPYTRMQCHIQKIMCELRSLYGMFPKSPENIERIRHKIKSNLQSIDRILDDKTKQVIDNESLDNNTKSIYLSIYTEFVERLLLDMLSGHEFMLDHGDYVKFMLNGLISHSDPMALCVWLMQSKMFEIFEITKIKVKREVRCFDKRLRYMTDPIPRRRVKIPTKLSASAPDVAALRDDVIHDPKSAMMKRKELFHEYDKSREKLQDNMVMLMEEVNRRYSACLPAISYREYASRHAQFVVPLQLAAIDWMGNFELVGNVIVPMFNRMRYLHHAFARQSIIDYSDVKSIEKNLLAQMMLHLGSVTDDTRIEIVTRLLRMNKLHPMWEKVKIDSIDETKIMFIKLSQMLETNSLPHEFTVTLCYRMLVICDLAALGNTPWLQQGFTCFEKWLGKAHLFVDAEEHTAKKEVEVLTTIKSFTNAIKLRFANKKLLYLPERSLVKTGMKTFFEVSAAGVRCDGELSDTGNIIASPKLI